MKVFVLVASFFVVGIVFAMLAGQSHNDSTSSGLTVKNPSDDFRQLKESYINNGHVVGNAHWHAHTIGSELYVQEGLRGILSCDDSFSFGCYHGVLEKMVLDLGAPAILEVVQECRDAFPEGVSDNEIGSKCIHGLGHGLVKWHKYNITLSLEGCDLLNGSYNSFCYDGVFMEYSLSGQYPGFDEDNPWEFCDSFALKYQKKCARYETALFLHVFPQDFNRVALECLRSQAKDLRETCTISLGHRLAQDAVGEIISIRQNCGLISSDEGEYLCIIGAAEEVIFQKYVNWEETSRALCEQLPTDWGKRCFAYK